MSSSSNGYGRRNNFHMGSYVGGQTSSAYQKRSTSIARCIATNEVLMTNTTISAIYPIILCLSRIHYQCASDHYLSFSCRAEDCYWQQYYNTDAKSNRTFYLQRYPYWYHHYRGHNIRWLYYTNRRQLHPTNCFHWKSSFEQGRCLADYRLEHGNDGPGSLCVLLLGYWGYEKGYHILNNRNNQRIRHACITLSGNPSCFIILCF